MSEKYTKYSIIVPVYNAIKYLPACIETVVSQDFDNYELIISDDNSDDGTTEYLHSLSYPNIRVVHPPHRLSMVEHFEWALTFACGEWCMFLGGDDGLQLYFFELAEQLTQMADNKNLRVIMSERAYFFWKGCDLLYGKTAVGYNARKQVKVLDSRYQSLLALLGFQTYFELPEMYTTSLFKKSLIDEAKNIMGGRLFSTIPPDANLGAIACSMEKKYLKSLIPLGWIGTSPSGVLYSMDSKDTTKLPKNIEYKNESGNFALRSCSIYYWNALQRTKELKSNALNKFITSNFFKELIFSGVLSEIKQSSNIDSKPRYEAFEKLLEANEINKLVVYALMPFIYIFQRFYAFKQRSFNFLYRFFYPSCRYNRNWEDGLDIDMFSESKKIYQKAKEKNILNILKQKEK